MLGPQNSIHSGKIKVQLSCIIGFEFACFQFDYNIATQVQIIEQQINIEVITPDIEVILIAKKSKPVPSSRRCLVMSFTSACSISLPTISSLNGIKSKIYGSFMVCIFQVSYGISLCFREGKFYVSGKILDKFAAQDLRSLIRRPIE